MDTSDKIIGQSDALKYVLCKVAQVAPTDSAVLIMGETGTGKELVARAIHAASARRDRPLVKLNCTVLPANLIESELFGHEPGSFTGAHSRRLGSFELAHRGTLFLDEVGELPPELQPRLLRVLEEGEFERTGGTRTHKLDVRIIAATNRDLAEEVRRGHFREDLWHRLSAYPITVLPLRQRREDIPLLVDFFVNKFSRKIGKSIQTVPPDTMRQLRDYNWPGNIRQLANVIERAVISTQDAELRLGEGARPGDPENQ